MEQFGVSTAEDTTLKHSVTFQYHTGTIDISHLAELVSQAQYGSNHDC